jgi:hypothetical protein
MTGSESTPTRRAEIPLGNCGLETGASGATALPLRDIVVFPHMIVPPLELGRGGQISGRCPPGNRRPGEILEIVTIRVLQTHFAQSRNNPPATRSGAPTAPRSES